MAELSELIKRRGQIRARITLFEKFLTPLLDTKLITKVQSAELSVRLGKLQELSSQYDDVQSKIDSLDVDEDKQIMEREDTENKFFRLIATAQELLEFFNENKVKNIDSSSTGNSSISQSHFRLPPLKLPTFDGDSSKWLEFRDMFLSLIHDNESINNISKFQYLRTYLEGSAKSVIQSVTVSSANYNVAWSLLCDRYNNKRLLINEHIKCLFSLESLPKESDKGIRNLIDTISKNLSALNSLGEPTDKWDSLIIYMASARLDPATARTWEEFRSNLDSPTIKDFFNFLRQRATVLETVHASKVDKPDKSNKFVKSKSFVTSSSFPSSAHVHGSCVACKQDHKLYECTKFKSMPVEERNAKIFQWKLCANCLRSGHSSYQCRLGGCRICKRKHNTLLHKQNSFLQTQSQSTTCNGGGASFVNKSNPPNNELSSSSINLITDPSCVISMSAVAMNQALLSTALVEVTNNGKVYLLRALLDSGSQSSFITEAAQVKIGLKKLNNNLQSVSGLNNASIKITEHCNLHMKSIHNSFNLSVKCYVLPIITDKLPQVAVEVNELGIPGHIKLADPNFHYPSSIDLLLGADIFWEILGSTQLKLGPNKPMLHETSLGWIIAGPMGGRYCRSQQTYCHFSKDIQQQLTKFWELEEIPLSDSAVSLNNDFCENLFNRTSYRDSDGRFCVQIPFSESTSVLGESYSIAEKRLLYMEKKMRKRSSLRQQYNEFMKEYESLGHMTEVPYQVDGCYLPHHAVIREKSETTKLRVVFDASAKTSSGFSLNNIQCVGPVVQDDLFSILLRFRQHRFVVTADVEKMYRQVLVEPNQRHLQMILWRDDEDQNMKSFQLNTVTYGTASAPFLSTRCLLQLSKECADENIARVIREDFYVDDLITGSNSKSHLNYILNKVTQVLNSACFPLRKFRTNAPSIFTNNAELVLPNDLNLCSQASTLGLRWDPSGDILKFPTDLKLPSVSTKRSILSSSAKLFDPLGLLSLCTIVPKILLQKLWLLKLDWDDPIPPEIEKQWVDFVVGSSNISNLKIPRFVIAENPISIELHFFCDASQNAYAACCYVRTVKESGEIVISLLCAKTKVAPVKPHTIPRLELCGSLLAARLASKVLKTICFTVTKTIYWTDSTVVLGWLASQARDLKPFVANRVAEIQQLTESGYWRHVPGLKNPADLSSRGFNPKNIHEASLWWRGPSFLHEPESCWPQTAVPLNDLPERKTSASLVVSLPMTAKPHYYEGIIDFERFSKFTILLRSISYVLRFIYNTRNPHSKKTGHLSKEELDASLTCLIKKHQSACFQQEIIDIHKNSLPNKSHLLSLNPFVDETEILRVGGRITNAPESYEKRYPILLDSNHHFTKLLFIHEHIKLLHCGPQLLLTTIRQNYWPVAGRRLASSTINKCKICFIMKANTVKPKMGILPTSRVTPTFPFHVAGVDFAGPFYIKDRKGRGCKLIKAYLCLFVCFTTRALHLELASDLSSEVFILCLRRFISRRGKPSDIYCDNGRNFVGTNNELSQFLKTCNESISSMASSEGIRFHFSPAYSPHFRGLWEAGVKSAKFHLTRMLGNNHLTFEELLSLFVQIEAILNSRPLTPLSSDPTDFEPLTPGHFLIGRPLTCVPSPALLDVAITRLNRYNQIEQLRQQFWERWRMEFLSELQQRSKWRVNQGELHEGDMVVVKEPNLPPLKWRLGRIYHLYQGPDGIARVADVKTSKGIIRRAFSNICPLPPRDPKVLERGEDVRT